MGNHFPSKGPEVSTPSLKDLTRRNLLFVSGKGGVGRTAVSLAIARTLADQGKRSLWVTFEDPTLPMGEITRERPNLWSLNCEATAAFEEYVALKIGVATLSKIFLQNKVIRYLAKASPGIHELVLLGKVWHEAKNYAHVVVDMPSTGYSLAMYHSVANFSKLFKGSGPIYKDTVQMMETFSDPKQSGYLVVALPEEMPLQEGLELDQFLAELFPGNPAGFIVNRCYPEISSGKAEASNRPLPESALDYLRKRSALEQTNLRLLRDKDIPFTRLGYVPPPLEKSRDHVVEKLIGELAERGLM